MLIDQLSELVTDLKLQALFYGIPVEGWIGVASPTPTGRQITNVVFQCEFDCLTSDEHEWQQHDVVPGLRSV